MAKRIATAILACAVMVLMAAAPLVSADTHHIVKGAQGPRASAVTWSYVPTEYGMWTGHIVNSGLRSLVVDVYDVTDGMSVESMHERIRFAAYDAYPSGPVDTNGVVMAVGHTYSVTATPNGPKGTFCDVEDMFKPAVNPVAMFTPTPADLTVTVDGSASSDADGYIVSWDWTFGDGGVATGEIASHTYLVAGTYTITLTVKDNDGLTGTDAQDVLVSAPIMPPVALFTPTMDFMTVSVDASASYDPDGGLISSYAWAFGDGMTGTGVTATHTYATEGLKTITLTVTDSDDGLTGTVSHDVTAVQPVPPVASFLADVLYLDVSVDAAASYDPDGVIVSYAWTFGDGGVATGMVASHKYAAAGTFTIALTVTDGEGLTGTASQDVPVTLPPPPVAAFTATVSGLTVDVDALSSSSIAGIASYSWNWGDGSPDGSGVTASHTFVPPVLQAIAPMGGSILQTPPPPYNVFGFTTDSSGAVVPLATVTITDMRTGVSVVVVSDPDYGYYEYNLNNIPSGWLSGDVIKVDAVKGTLSGSAQGTAISTAPYLWLDITMSGQVPVPFDVTITLTVTDIYGQTDVVAQTFTLTP